MTREEVFKAQRTYAQQVVSIDGNKYPLIFITEDGALCEDFWGKEVFVAWSEMDETARR